MDRATLEYQQLEASRLLRDLDPIERQAAFINAAKAEPPDWPLLRAVYLAPKGFPLIDNAELLATVRETLAERRFPARYAERRRLQSAIGWRRHTWARTMQHLRELTGVEFPVDVDPLPMQAGLEPTEPEENPVADAVAQSAMSE